MPWDVQAVFCRRRHQPRRPPLAKIRPRSPAPAIGPGTGYGSCGIDQDRPGEMGSGAVAHDMKNLGNIERLAGHNATKREKIGAKLTIDERVRSDERTATDDIVVAEQRAIGAQENLLDQCPSTCGQRSQHILQVLGVVGQTVC